MKIGSSNLKSIIVTIVAMAVIGGMLAMAIPTLSISAAPTNAPEVWVNDDWIVNGSGDIVDGHIFGTDAFATINNGVYNVLPGGKVNVYPGTYNEGVTINKAVILNGSRAGVPGGDGSRGSDEAIINGSNGGVAIEVTSNDVVINGFEIAYNTAINFGIKATTANNLVVNNTRILSGKTIAIGVAGDYAILKDNYIFVPKNQYGLVNGTGNNAEISGNRMNLNKGVGNLTTWTGDNVNIHDNLIGQLVMPEGVSAADVTEFAPASGMLYAVGNNVDITDNTIGSPSWNYSYGIVVRGNGNDVVGNDLYADQCEFDAIFMGALTNIPAVGTVTGNDIVMKGIGNNSINVTGDAAVISGNTVNVNQINDSAVRAIGSNALVSDNTVNVPQAYENVLEVSGSYPTVRDNTLNLGDVNYYDDEENSDGISVKGINATVTNNGITATYIFDYGIEVNSTNAVITANVVNVDATSGPVIDNIGDNARIGDNDLNVKSCGDSIAYFDVLWSKGNDTLISGNYVGNESTDAADGIYSWGNNARILANTVTADELVMYDFINVCGCGIEAYGSNLQVIGNEIYADNVESAGILAMGLDKFDGAVIEDNTIDIGYLGLDSVSTEAAPQANDKAIDTMDVKAAALDVIGIGIYNAVYIEEFDMIRGSEGTTVTGNEIYSDDELAYAIYVEGDNGSVCDNTVEAEDIGDEIINYEGYSGIIDHNILTVSDECDYDGILYEGMNATITYNEICVYAGYCDGIDFDAYGGGDFGANITGNVIDCYYVSSDAIEYAGPAGLIADNEISIDMASTGISVESNEGMLVRDNRISGDNVDEAMEIYCDEGMVTGNEINFEKVNSCGIFYSGDAGNVIGNYDYGENLAEYPLIVYLSSGEGLIKNLASGPSFGTGHGTIEDNVGGGIIYMGDLYYDDDEEELVSEPANYGSISNNTIDSYWVGITAYGDFNAIDNNTIKAVYGISSKGFMDTIADNTIDASYKEEESMIPLSAGIGFDGDKNTVVRNEIYNATFGIFNVGMFTVEDLMYMDSMPTGTSASVNDTLDSFAANVTRINGFADDYFGARIAKAGVQAADADDGMQASAYAAPAVDAKGIVQAIDGLGYRGYGNVISDNRIINDWTEVIEFSAIEFNPSDNLVGIASLGYDFVVSDNVIDNKNASTLLAGIIVGGNGGKVTNNEIYNVTALGAYYGGLLEFEGEELVPSDLLGMDAVITGNLVDNSQYTGRFYLYEDPLIDELMPVGIAFTGYNGDIKDNDLPGVGTGIVTLQYGGSVADNTIDGYRPARMLINSLADGPGHYPGSMGMLGLMAVGDNVTVTGNDIKNMSLGMAFAGLDSYSKYGNVLIADNTLTNNMVQMAYVPGFFLFNLDGTPAELNTTNLVEVLGDNTLDRAIYVTDSWTGELVQEHMYFGIPMVAVFGDLNYAADAAQDYGEGKTVNVRPGVYGLYAPIYVDTMGMTFLGDPLAPYTTIVDTAPMAMLGDLSVTKLPGSNAFDVYRSGTTISGFEITNTSNTVPVDRGLVNYGIAVGYMPEGTGSTVMAPFGYVSDCLFTNNTILNMSTGIYLDACSGTTIQYNKLKGNAIGVYLTDVCNANSTEIHYNDIAGNTEYGVNNKDALLAPEALATGMGPSWVNATYNWWGSYTGPHDVTKDECTSPGDCVTYYVWYEPYLTKPVFSTLYTYHLVPGWNLIDVPLDVPDSSLTGFFPADVLDGVVIIWGWNESVQNWELYSADPEDDFYDYYPEITSLETGRGYWVDMSKEAYFVVEGAVPDCAPASPVPLVEQWNLVGPTGICSSTPDALYPDAVIVWGWNESVQNWELHSADPEDDFYDYYPEITSVMPGHGYWVDQPEEA